MGPIQDPALYFAFILRVMLPSGEFLIFFAPCDHSNKEDSWTACVMPPWFVIVWLSLMIRFMYIFNRKAIQ